MTPAQILDKAADEILERGLARETYEAPDDGRVCLVGAMHVVCGRRFAFSDLEDSPAVRFLADEIVEQERFVHPWLEYPAGLVEYWNDHRCADKEEAALMLRAAAKRAEAEQ